MVIAVMKFKKRLLLGRKVMANLDSILKIRDITFPTKVRPVKAVVFLVVMYGCESWTIKKAECWRTDAVELWCWRRLLRVPWTARRPNQSILKEISPAYSLEGLRLKLKLQYFGQLMQRSNSLEKTLILGRIEGRRRRGWQKVTWLDGIPDSMDMSLSKLQGVGDGQGRLLQSMGLQRVGRDLATELNLHTGGAPIAWGLMKENGPSERCNVTLGDLNVHVNLLGILSRCKFRFSRSRGEPESLYFLQVLLLY